MYNAGFSGSVLRKRDDRCAAPSGGDHADLVDLRNGGLARADARCDQTGYLIIQHVTLADMQRQFFWGDPDLRREEQRPAPAGLYGAVPWALRAA